MRSQSPATMGNSCRLTESREMQALRNLIAMTSERIQQRIERLVDQAEAGQYDSGYFDDETFAGTDPESVWVESVTYVSRNELSPM